MGSSVDYDSSDDNSPSFPPLDNGNYGSWHHNMKRLLVIKELWQVTVQEREVPKVIVPKDEEDAEDYSNEEFPKLDAWDRMELRASELICAHLEKTQFRLLGNLMRPKEIWNALAKHHIGSGIRAHSRWHRELIRLKKFDESSGQTMGDHQAKIREIVGIIELLGEAPDELFVIEVFLNSLPSSSITPQIVENLTDEEYTLENIFDRASAEFQRKTERAGKSKSARKGEKERRICLICGKNGHLSQKCRD